MKKESLVNKNQDQQVIYKTDYYQSISTEFGEVSVETLTPINNTSDNGIIYNGIIQILIKGQDENIIPQKLPFQIDNALSVPHAFSLLDNCARNEVNVFRKKLQEHARQMMEMQQEEQRRRQTSIMLPDGTFAE